ncbi:MAG TPA: methionyl-tRNA formyltransferase [Candidatus Limnocylindrales bacterium]|nr:methionyl-tRNA formyltransferase [Candidatus Limnocylindrales bacterium]
MTASPAADAAATGPARTIFFGSGPFAVPMLAALLELPEVDVVAVVTVPDRPAGRGRLLSSSPVAVAAAGRNLRLLQPGSIRDPNVAEQLAAERPTLGVLADYGRIVPPAVLEIPKRGFLNVHPSLLPRHRGASPIPAAILGGDTEAGVTIIEMDPGLDTGPIVASTTFPVPANATAPEVERRAAEVGAALLARVAPAWIRGEITARSQPADGASLSRPLSREDGRLDGSEAAAIAERRIRAFDPWPGTFIEAEVDGGIERAAILRGAVAGGGDGGQAGTLVADGSGLALETIDGRLRLLDVRPAGRGAMTGAEWRRGRPQLVGASVVARQAPAVARP